MRATSIQIGVLLLVGCGAPGGADPASQYLGTWTLRSGDKTVDCGAGAQVVAISNPHQVRFVRGLSSDLTLQFFSGELATPPPTCELPFETGNVSAALVAEQTCGEGTQAATWHTSLARFTLVGDLTLDTHLSDAQGCAIEARPVYFRSP